MHRCCTGLSLAVFNAVSSSAAPFHCLICQNSLLLKEVSCLKDTVSSLKKEISDLKSTGPSNTISLEVTALQEKVSTLSHVVSQLKTSNQQEASNELETHQSEDAALGQFSNSTNPPTTTSAKPASSRNRPSNSIDLNERKYNIILFGVTEMPRGSSRSERFSSDYEEVSNVLARLEENSEHICLIRDCRRVGRYNPQSERPRPLLVTLGSTSDVSYILSKRRSLTSPLSIRRDFSPSQRSDRSILFREKDKLVESGIDIATIKIRKSHLYVSDRLVGRVANGVYISSQSLGELASSLSELGTSLSVSQTDLSTSQSVSNSHSATPPSNTMVNSSGVTPSESN
uniref:Uncharacterized protein n=1 Tax=Amphimedon queenslandica TaxID=400682 RepID=A0A1X7SIT1_AMPQE